MPQEVLNIINTINGAMHTVIDLHRTAMTHRAHVEAHVPIAAEAVRQRTTTRVSTRGTISPTSIKRVWSIDCKIALIIIGEPTRLLESGWNLLMIYLRDHMDLRTCVGLLTDPCQASVSIRMLKCTNF